MKLTKEDRLSTGELQPSELKYNPRYIVKVEDEDSLTTLGISVEEYNNFKQYRPRIIKRYLDSRKDYM